MKRLIERKIGFVPITLIMAMVVGIAIGSILVSKQVSMPMTIVARVDMALYDKDETTPLTTIELGDFYRGDTKRFPSFGDYFIKNTGECYLWYSWTKENFPAGVKIDVYIIAGTHSPPLYKLAEGEIYTGYDDPNRQECRWYIEITALSDATFGSYAPNLIWRGHDSSTG